MASPTTINTWMEELVLSFSLPSAKADVHRYKDNFIRTVRHHNYGRTNQFAVDEKLTGLEEKLQVYNLDDVAAELFSRRAELKKDHNDIKWLPDVLDLLLHLSHDPVHQSRIENLEKLEPRSETPVPLSWEEIDAEDPINHQDEIWRLPKYSDSSSDEDEFGPSDTPPSPVAVKHDVTKNMDVERLFETPVAQESAKLEAAQFWHRPGPFVAITETQASREVLFMLTGMPTSIFTITDHRVRPKARYCLGNLGRTTSKSLLEEAARLGSNIGSVRRWLRIPQGSAVMQFIQSAIRGIMTRFELAISKEHAAILHRSSPTGVISLLQTLRKVERESHSLKAVSTIVSDFILNDPISTLNTIHSHLDTAHTCSNSVEVETFLPIFLSSLTLYSKPIDVWLLTGRIDTTEPFFVFENEGKPRLASTLWHDWFTLATTNNLIPIFLEKFAEKIFAIGKTAAFMHHLGRAAPDICSRDLGIVAAAAQTAHLVTSSPLPFSATFEMILDRHLGALLDTSTTALRHILETSCGLTRFLDALDYLYLAKDGVLLDSIESKMFDRIDRCLEMWNDRFLLSDLLAEAFQDSECVDVDAITIQAAYTSSRSMENRRRSVKILAAVSVSYHVSWPIANIILPASMISYQRVALMLNQVRRARSLLASRAYFHVQHMPLPFDNLDEHRVARLVYWQLSHFANTLYSHLTSCTVQAFTTTMRDRLYSSSTRSLDDMIAIHTQYIAALEHACLSSKRIKPLRDALVTILDLCIRFTDLVTWPSTSIPDTMRPASGEGAHGDFEASSFISARSQKRRRGGRRQHDGDQYSSSDDDDDASMGEGYSTFVLEQDTSLFQEIVKVRDTFKKHVEFLIAWLRAVARSPSSNSSSTQGQGQGQRPQEGWEVGQNFELLADSLEGVFPLSKRVAF
ncbi:uncharacterized protein Z520_10172 [Fonsecaea multimorphosa CBS 102226]|uniref:Spindle pole body component n=1 Tax=Fonsecaea multimorphosa CBS 102226 TaxID=1442371 RepID=A0A0D2IAG4_9EURO|nr:uncharacterized protein Z520_10172 [Fonsecaea multimorphosa CBS 102226]KIX94146.1 hypothetical protein Z520_10172 [Fonsecaea multimorphosa CBS 102226]OAL19499.1 hypothetical protein AYO22_09661 [Fonsecaea multimorphosa]